MGCHHSSVDSSPPTAPGFESQAHYLHFYHTQFNLCYTCLVKRTKINTKRPGLAGYFLQATTFVGRLIHLKLPSFNKQALHAILFYGIVFTFLRSLFVSFSTGKYYTFACDSYSGEGKYHCTADLLFDWIGLNK